MPGFIDASDRGDVTRFGEASEGHGVTTLAAEKRGMEDVRRWGNRKSDRNGHLGLYGAEVILAEP